MNVSPFTLDAEFFLGRFVRPYRATRSDIVWGIRMSRRYTVSARDLERYLDRHDGADLRRLSKRPSFLRLLLQRVVAGMKGVFSEMELQRYVKWMQWGETRQVKLGESLERKLASLSHLQRAALDNVFITAWHDEPERNVSVRDFCYRAGWVKASTLALR